MPGSGAAGRAFLPALLAAAALLLPSCHRETPRPLHPPRPRNLIFILVDTLRADALSAYGYGRRTSPDLDAFARRAVRFDDVRSQATCTFPSVNSILTSRWPAAFLGQPKQGLGIPPGIPSLAEILHGHGFHTVAVSASPIVRKAPSRFNPGGGFGGGFDVFDDGCVWQESDCVNAAALPHVRRGDKPLFLYLHYLDPHGPYRPPPFWRLRFATGTPAKEWVRKGDPNPIGDWLYKKEPNPGFTPDDLRHLRDLYDDEIRFFDSSFAGMLAALRKAGLLDESIVVLAADHGEEFLEHGDIKHCRNLFDTTARVPLLVRVPGGGPRVVRRPVQNLDLVPTLLDLLGIDARGVPFEGHSLRADLEGNANRTAGELQYALQGSLRSIADGRFKLIESLAGAPPLLFDLTADPGETRNLFAADRRDAARLHDALKAWLARTEGKGMNEAARAAQEKLRSLGYIE
jgi:arylsulfatase A-like enzyme